MTGPSLDPTARGRPHRGDAVAAATTGPRPGYDLGPLPDRYLLRVVDERVVRSAIAPIFDLARDVASWPRHLGHYRYVRFREQRDDGGGLVEMSANRPFGPVDWPTWWLSRMQVVDAGGSAGRRASATPTIRFRHVEGVTAGMEVEWSFHPHPDAETTLVRIVHLWDGPSWPLVGTLAARGVIGPVFVHGIASRTLAGLATAAENTRVNT
jgi:hypothetical protein